MRNHFRPKPPPPVTITPPESDDNSDIEILDAPKAHAANPEQTPTSSEASESVALFVGYLSDEISGPSDEEPEPEVEWEPQQPKRRKLDVPYRVQRVQDQERRRKEKEDALAELKKMVKSKKTTFDGGSDGLQAQRIRSMIAHLSLVIKNGYSWGDAARMAAETSGFAKDYGGRQICSWNRNWISHQLLPTSKIGKHIKTYSLLPEPGVAAEMRIFLRTNKWSMSPAKLREFSKQSLVETAMQSYAVQAQNVIRHEMPMGLKRFLEGDLLPRIHAKAVQGISIETARRCTRRASDILNIRREFTLITTQDRM